LQQSAGRYNVVSSESQHGKKCEFFYAPSELTLYSFLVVILLISHARHIGALVMRKARLLQRRAALLVLFILVVSPFPLLLTTSQHRLISNQASNSSISDGAFDQSGATKVENARLPLDTWTISDSAAFPEPVEGVLKPVTIEQSGYSSTGNVTARTDTSVNTQQTINIDTSHDWVADQAVVNVSNMQRLYVVNGTFDDGYPGYTVSPNGTIANHPFGWGAISTNGDSTLEQTQEVSYEVSSEQYVTAQNKAKLTNQGQKQYTHYIGTKVLWNQTFQNTPYTNQFLLSFEYLLLQGPLNSSLSNKYSLKAFIDGSQVSSINLPLLSKKGTWFESGVIPVNLVVPVGAVSFMIGLVIDTTFNVYSDRDYDGDGIADGVANTQYIKVCLDDVSLIGAVSPSCENVDLHLSVNGLSTLVIGSSGMGEGTVINESYWTTNPLLIAISSNTSILLDYNVRLLNHRFINSSYATNTLLTGVAYTVNSNQSGSLDLFTYLGFLGIYENLVIKIHHPVDWQNFTILDPFLADVTHDCSLFTNYLVIPTSILNRLGWWKILCESPNYASSAVVQRFDNGITDWVNETIFHSNEFTHASVFLSSGINIPVMSDPVSFSWMLPNGSLWYQSFTVSGLIGAATSAPITFGPMNTTAGSWGLIYQWTNGSELAYSCVRFDLHHTAALGVVFSNRLETVVGQPVTVFLKFNDTENGMILIGNGAEVTGTWAAGVVDFEPNIVNNWWQADFDTALVGAGNFEISITSAAPYFETVPLIITIKSHFLTSLQSPTGPLQPLVYGHHYSFDYFYSMDYNGSGIKGASVEVTGAGSEWSRVTDNGNGHYNLSLTPLGLHEYSIFVSFSKVGYENHTDTLSFLVNKVPIDVSLLTVLSGREYQPLTIEVNVTEVSTGTPISNANVSLSVLTQYGISYASVVLDEVAPGIYSGSIIIPPAGDTTYDAIIVVEKENYEMAQDYNFALVPTFDANARLIQTVTSYSWQILLFAGLIGSVVVGQKFYSRKNRIKRAAARSIKMRFNDANNLLGVVVLHRLSGIPIYSKILKGGFEEGMLSAFITAIIHFRAEFDKKREKDGYIIIPISDIVRAVPTENLICAFITITSASKAQEERMINYARAIGMMFDETFAERPSQVIDTQTIRSFEWMFDDFVDGILLRPYKIGEKQLPKKLRCVEETVNSSDGVNSFLLINLIRLLETCNIDEDDAYLLVMDAVEQKCIIPIYSTDILEN
jgi:hypothetical protein